MKQAAKSQRLVAPWRRGSGEEESRAYLQTRLTTLFKLLFWCFIALMAFLFVAYQGVAGKYEPPHYQPYVYAAFVVGISMQAFIWRVVLLRRKLSFDALHMIDTTFIVGSNAIITLCAVLSYDKRPSAYTCLIYACWTVLTRALIVPSTGKRTAVVTTISMTPMAIGVAWLAWNHQWEYRVPPVSPDYVKDVPPVAMVVGFLQIAVVAVLLSASGSRIIYGLTQKASAVKQLGQYTLGRLLGEGGNGKVYLAHHLLLRRPTAIKLVPAAKVGVGSLERFEREVQFMSQLTHPNTVAVYDYGHAGGEFYYAMEYLGGGINLQDLVTRHGKQGPERTRLILMQVCSALQEAHERNLIHRDIKPANIILCERGGMPDVVKVVDYGLVKELTTDTGASTQIVLGTPAYIAPEAVTDPAHVGPGVDLYAVGAVGYFMLSAQRVFTGATDLDTCLKHVTQPPAPLATHGVDVSPALEAVIMQCLAKSPADRPASAQALADLLHSLGPFSDWDDERASQWWAKHRPAVVPAEAADLPTATLSIDLAEREETPLEQ